MANGSFDTTQANTPAKAAKRRTKTVGDAIKVLEDIIITIKNDASELTYREALAIAADVVYGQQPTIASRQIIEAYPNKSRALIENFKANADLDKAKDYHEPALLTMALKQAGIEPVHERRFGALPAQFNRPHIDTFFKTYTPKEA